MDRQNRMNSSNTSCRRNSCRGNSAGCGCQQEASHTEQRPACFPPAMGYVPCQKFQNMFDTCKGLQLGTLFPELCKPFCGTGGGCR